MEVAEAALRSFILSVDEVPPTAKVLDDAAAWLLTHSFRSPAMLEGVTEQDLDSSDLPPDLVTRALLKRTLRCVEAAQSAKRFEGWKGLLRVPRQVRLRLIWHPRFLAL